MKNVLAALVSSMFARSRTPVLEIAEAAGKRRHPLRAPRMRRSSSVLSSLFLLLALLTDSSCTLIGTIAQPETGEELAALFTKAHSLFEEGLFQESHDHFSAFLEVSIRLIIRSHAGA